MHAAYLWCVCKDTDWRQWTSTIRESRSDASVEWVLQRLTTVRQTHKHRWPFGNQRSADSHNPKINTQTNKWANVLHRYIQPVSVRMSVCVCVRVLLGLWAQTAGSVIPFLVGTNVNSALPLASLLLPKTQDNAVQPPNWVSLKRFIGMLLNILTFF